MEQSSILQGVKCPYKKGLVGDDICISCPNFKGYVDKNKSYRLMLKYTYDKNTASNVDGWYFYICEH